MNIGDEYFQQNGTGAIDQPYPTEIPSSTIPYNEYYASYNQNEYIPFESKPKLIIQRKRDNISGFMPFNKPRIWRPAFQAGSEYGDLPFKDAASIQGDTVNEISELAFNFMTGETLENLKEKYTDKLNAILDIIQTLNTNRGGKNTPELVYSKDEDDDSFFFRVVVEDTSNIDWEALKDRFYEMAEVSGLDLGVFGLVALDRL